MEKVKEKFCPKCGADISHTYEPADTGMPDDSWYCDECELAVFDEAES